MVVADWSQAKIGYTNSSTDSPIPRVADWSQAKIGYTHPLSFSLRVLVADWSQAKIGYTSRSGVDVLPDGCGLVSGQDWLH